MPDLAMCYNSDCPLSLSCLRFTAQPSEWQGYHHFEPKDGKCEFFRPNGEKSSQEPKNQDHE